MKMYRAFQSLLVCLTILSSNVIAAPPPLLPRDTTPASPSHSELENELGSSLSKKALIYFPGSAQFKNLTARWAENVTPQFLASVEPGTEEDVATIVKFARKYNIDFLAINRAHGTTTALSNVKQGIQINLRQLRSIEVAADGKSAKLGGGVFNDDTTTALAAIGKASGSGAAGCVGLMGAGLGGGYGRYEGYTGLVLDNIIDMDVVLANGTSVFVSGTSNPDLYWAMRGAGHNFGIVTKLTYKLHDALSPTWYLSNMIFTRDKLEPVFEQLNKLIANGTMPVRVINYALFVMDPNISTTDPVISLNIFYIGTAAEAEPYAKPFWDIGPVKNTIQNFSTSYPGIFYAAQTGLYDPVCAEPQAPAYLFGIHLKTYNVPVMNQLFTLYADKIKANPKFNQSNVMLEGYSLEAVKAVPSDSTAFAHRDENILIGFLPKWPLGSGLDQEADDWAKQARSLLVAGKVPPSPLTTYVNYAHGDEPLEALYGYEPWRLERLRALKKQYDPDFQFKFYNPIS